MLNKQKKMNRRGNETGVKSKNFKKRMRKGKKTKALLMMPFRLFCGQESLPKPPLVIKKMQMFSLARTAEKAKWEEEMKKY